MPYPKIPDFKQLTEHLTVYAQTRHEYGAKGVAAALARAEKALKQSIAEINKLPIDQKLAAREPNGLPAILRLRPNGPRRMWNVLDRQEYRRRIEGALLGRMAGCTLGAPVEQWTIEDMRDLARENGDPFPPTDYWKYVPRPFELRYRVEPRQNFTRTHMNGVPVDDDIAYTILGLLIVEDYGPDFTIEQTGEGWIKYVPYAYTAEQAALDNLRAGVPARRAAEKNNPYCEWIGGDIRSDPWAYIAPGWPERAAEMAYRHTWLTHRRQGLYGAMYFAAAISAAFAVDDPVEALRIGLSEIPRDCAMARAVRWALRVAPEIRDWREARDAVDEKFNGMHQTHTINNACLTIFGITIGGTDFTRVIGETVAMGLDNDCTAATAGSLVGAIVGKRGIPAHWHKKFNNRVRCYLTGRRRFTVGGLVNRFSKQASKLHSSK